MAACGSYSVGPCPLPVSGFRGSTDFPLYKGIKADSDSKGATAVGGGGVLLLFYWPRLCYSRLFGVSSGLAQEGGQAPCLFSLPTRSASRSLAKFNIGAANMRLGYYLGQWGDAVPAARTCAYSQKGLRAPLGAELLCWWFRLPASFEPARLAAIQAFQTPLFSKSLQALRSPLTAHG
jgi:hypothetical protein